MSCNCKPHDCNCHLKEGQMLIIKKLEYQAWLAQANELIKQLEPIVGKNIIDEVLLKVAPTIFSRIIIEGRDINETPVEIQIKGAPAEIGEKLSQLLRAELMCNWFSYHTKGGCHETNH